MNNFDRNFRLMNYLFYVALILMPIIVVITIIDGMADQKRFMGQCQEAGRSQFDCEVLYKQLNPPAQTVYVR